MKTISCVLFNAVVFLVLASAFAPQKAAAQTRDTMTVQPNYQVYQQAPAIAITPKEVMVAAPPPPQPVPTVSEVGAIKTLVVPSAPPPASPPPPMTAIQEVPKLIAGDPCLAKGTTDSLEYQCCKMASKSGDTAVRLTREGTGGMNQDIYDCCVNKAIPVHPDTAVTPDETQQCSCSINPRNTACFSCFGRQSVDQFVSCFSQQ